MCLNLCSHLILFFFLRIYSRSRIHGSEDMNIFQVLKIYDQIAIQKPLYYTLASTEHSHFKMFSVIDEKLLSFLSSECLFYID